MVPAHGQRRPSDVADSSIRRLAAWRRNATARAAAAVVNSPLRDSMLSATARLARTRPNHVASSAAFHLGRALARDGGTITGRICSGSRIVLDTCDHAHMHVFFFGLLEPANTELFRRLSSPGWTVLDVGANSGYFSLLAWDLGGPQSKIHAFEPNPVLAPRIAQSASLNGAELAVVQAAVGDRPGNIRLYLSNDAGNTGLSSIHADGWGVGTSWIDVSMVTLDQYCADARIEPDFVKIDAEGAEADIIGGMRDLLASRVPQYLLCELAREDSRPDPQAVIDAIEGSGYRAFSVLPDGTLTSLRPFVAADVCFARA